MGSRSIVRAVFFDLETSDLEPVGQILNFCFIAVDQDFTPLDTLKGDVSISRLQLPRAGAILANRIDVLDHQGKASFCERDAVLAIRKFIVEHTSSSRNKIPLVGFNSASFDLDYLRTVFVRNGFSPYLNYVSRDLLLLSQYLLLTNADFRTLVTTVQDGEKVNLKLERLCQVHKLLDGSQLHESEHDVLLTIALARTFRDQYDIDICEFEPYRAKSLHGNHPGRVCELIEPTSSRASAENYSRSTHAVLLEADDRYALWANVEKFVANKSRSESALDCIRFLKYAGNVLIPGEINPISDDLKCAGLEVFERFKGLTVQKFFAERERGMKLQDLEQHIYRLTPRQIDELALAIQGEHSTNKGIMLTDELRLKSPYQRQIWRRYFLENWRKEWGQEREFEAGLRRYVSYRYGGRLLLAMIPESSTREDLPKKFHPTLAELYAEIEARREQANSVTDSASLGLLESLRRFYQESEVQRYATD